jgi:hypothetical protein
MRSRGDSMKILCRGGTNCGRIYTRVRMSRHDQLIGVDEVQAETVVVSRRAYGIAIHTAQTAESISGQGSAGRSELLSTVAKAEGTGKPWQDWAMLL